MWFFKLIVKYCLGLLRVPYGFWQKFGLFRHGHMDMPALAARSTLSLMAGAGLPEDAIQLQSWIKGRNFLEIGPGDSTLTGQVPLALGAGSVKMIDVGNFAVFRSDDFSKLRKILVELGYMPIDWETESSSNVQSALLSLGLEYLTGGNVDLRSLDAGSIDFSFSNAVFEHVQRSELRDFAAALFRAHAPNSIGIHRIDFRDHLVGGRNHLRFPSWLWESKLTQSNGLYLNRVNLSEFVEIFSNAGFECSIVRTERRFQDMFSSKKLASDLASWATQDLTISGADLMLRAQKDSPQS